MHSTTKFEIQSYTELKNIRISNTKKISIFWFKKRKKNMCVFVKIEIYVLKINGVKMSTTLGNAIKEGV